MKLSSYFRTLPLDVVIATVLVVFVVVAIVEVVVAFEEVVVAIVEVVVAIVEVVVAFGEVVVVGATVVEAVVVVVLTVVEAVVVVVVAVVVSPAGRDPAFLAVGKLALSRASKPSSFAFCTSFSVASATSSGSVSFGASASNS